MTSLYTTSVSDVPANYNDATSAYKKHVWIAVAGIFAFFAFYFFLTFLFFSSAYRLLSGGTGGFVGIGIGVASLFLGIFMIKSFFFINTKHDVTDRQVKPEEEPLLFDFLHKLADEIGAPRPSKVYLSNRVNASVFYDLSFVNLFFPSKKNLEIGLGLINILNLGEFKAVLAHEYGHFAQKSMLVGRWVYIANQIASSIITRRDALDTLLNGLSRIDLRVAWIGWILSIIVWSIRSLVELIFRVVVLSQRALSREMEFQADLVAVSVTGSDALIHALHKLQAADAALSDAMSALNDRLGKGEAIEDLYAIQSNSVEKTAYILNDDEYGKSPKIPATNPESNRVFSDKIAQPPKMWLTHPPDQEREANAKRNYISGDIDDRNAWDLFSNPTEIRVGMTRDLIAGAKVKTEVLSTTEAVSIHNKQFDRSYFNPAYRGAYLNRFLCQDYKTVDEIYLTGLSTASLDKTADELYPQTLVEELEDFKTLQEEYFQMKAIKEKKLTSTGDSGIWHRGTQIRRKELPKVVDSIKSESDAAKKIVTDHDRMARTVHLKMGESIGQGWGEYLKGLLSMIHFSEHNITNINDAHNNLGHVLQVVMADNKVSNNEMRILIQQCNDVHRSISSVADVQAVMTLDDSLRKELGITESESLFEKFEFPGANKENINDWVRAISGWVGSYVYSLDKLRSEALELLLRSESKVKEMYASNQVVPAPAPSAIGANYKTLLPGEERKPAIKMTMWDKFITADGIVSSLVKFVVAGSIVGGTLWYAGHTGLSDITIYNGLGQPVNVDLNGSSIVVQPYAHVKSDFSEADDFTIRTTTQKGESIESFMPRLERTSKHYVYNVASASALLEYKVYYGGIPGDYAQSLGSRRWSITDVDYIFEEAPDQIKSSKSGTTKMVLGAFHGLDALSIFGLGNYAKDQEAFIRSHAMWDPADAPNVLQWISAAATADDAVEVLESRLERNPHELISLRLLMDHNDESREKICDEFADKAQNDPLNADIYYVVTRCLPEGNEKQEKYLEGAKKWPNHGWMNYAASHYLVNRNDWAAAYGSLVSAYQNSGDLKPIIALNAERILRYIKAKGMTVKETSMQSEYLDNFKSLERGDINDPSVHVHHLIHTGKLQEAIDMSSRLPDMGGSIMAICAASDGAQQEWIDKAVKLSPDSLSQVGVMAVAALRLKKNMDISGYMEAIDEVLTEEEGNATQLIDFMKAGNYKAAEKILDDRALSTRGEFYAFANVAFGNRIPDDWKLKAKSLLFAGERPYIK